MIQIYRAAVGDSEVIHYMPMVEEEPATFGEALTLTAEGLTKCAATAKPKYICRGIAQPDGTIPVGEVMATTLYEVPYSAKPEIAAKVQLDTDGLRVTATTGGSFLVVAVDENRKIAIGNFEDVTA